MTLVSSTRAQRWLRVAPLSAALLLCAGVASAQIKFNELRIDNPGTDTDEYVELSGPPSQSLAGLTYIIIGDGAGGCGVVENVTDLGAQSIQADGFFAAHRSGTAATLAGYDAELTLNLENTDNVTHLLVTGWTGTTGQDLDTNNDGVLDVTPWTTIVDGVSVKNNVAPDCTTVEFTYSPNIAGGTSATVPMFVYKCGASWVVGPDTVGAPPSGSDTPGAANDCGNQEPTITNLANLPFVVNPAEVATIRADVTDSDGTVASVTLFYRLNGGAFSSTAMALGTAPTYSATIPGQVLGTVVDYYVRAIDNLGATQFNPVGAPGVFKTYTVANDVITTIANIHANLGTLTGTRVQVRAQVYCPGNYKGPGNTTSGYVQDTSGRGLNIFGDVGSYGQSLLNDITNIVVITGTVEVFSGTTVELTSYDVQLMSTGNPALTPAIQASTAAAAGPGNEGTFIQAVGVITAIEVTGTVPNTTHNFTINDGSGPVIIRVDDDLRNDLDTAFHINDQVRGRGAGTTFTGQGEILVCDAAGIALTGVNAPPLLNSAVLAASNQVRLTFNEGIDPATGNTAGNYAVFQTSNPGATIGVTTAAVQVPNTQVLLTLAGNVPANISHTVRVNNVKDLGGATIAPNTTAIIQDPNLGVGAIQITEIMQNPGCTADANGEWFELRNHGAVAIDLNGWTIQDNGLDSHVIDNGGPLLIGPNQYKVFGRDAATLSTLGITAFYQYANFVLGNGADDIVVLNPAGSTVDQVNYSGAAPWPVPNATSMQWNETGDNNDPTTWNIGGHTFGCGDTGTPGAPVDYSTPAPPMAVGVTRLVACQPNPFNPTATIVFSLAQRERVTLTVYNLRGQRVRTLVSEELPAGLHSDVRWDGRDEGGATMPSGVYLVQLATASGHVESMKVGLVK